MKPTKLTTAAAALAFAALLGASAHADQAPAGDLILGFEQAGSSNVYEVDIGSASQFLNPLAKTQNFTLESTDLSLYFGSTWATNTTAGVQWGILGGTQTLGDLTLAGNPGKLAANTLFVTWNTFSTAPAESTNNGQKNTTNAYNALSGDYWNGSTGASGDLNTAITTTSDVNGFAKLESSSGNFGPNFGLPAGFSSSILGYKSDGTIPAADAVTLDLYELTPTGADTGNKPTTLLGTFNLSQGGVLSFTEAPEPSIYLLMGMGGLVLVWRLRRNASLVA